MVNFSERNWKRIWKEKQMKATLILRFKGLPRLSWRAYTPNIRDIFLQLFLGDLPEKQNKDQSTVKVILNNLLDICWYPILECRAVLKKFQELAYVACLTSYVIDHGPNSEKSSNVTMVSAKILSLQKYWPMRVLQAVFIILSSNHFSQPF